MKKTIGQKILSTLLAAMMLLMPVVSLAATATCDHPSKVLRDTMKEPTCTEDGLGLYYCLNCQSSLEESIPALGHSWDGGSVTTPATCTAAGVKTFTCTRCGSTYTEAIPATGHTPEVIPGVAASCEAGGKTEGSRCSTCGAILSAQADIPATGHNWGGWVVDVPPNCEQGGLEYMTCQNCGAQQWRYGEALGHDWDEGKVTKDPGFLNPGETTYTCLRCGAEKTEEIPADDGGTTMRCLLRNKEGIPGDPAGKGPDEEEPLHIVIQPDDGVIEGSSVDDVWYILRVKAEGGVEPYQYTWYRVRQKKFSSALTGSHAFTGTADFWQLLTGKYASLLDSKKSSLTSLTAGDAGFPGISIFLDPPVEQWVPTLFDEEILYNDVDNYWAEEPGTYYCVVTDAEGTFVKSETADVIYSVRIKDQSHLIYTSGDETGNAFVKVYGGTPPYTYQWYEDHGALAHPIEGATSATLEIPAHDSYDWNSEIVEDVGGGELRGYFCIITDSAQGEFQTSCMSEDIRVYRQEPLWIDYGETDLSILPGEKADFQYTVYGGSGTVTIRMEDISGNEITQFDLPDSYDPKKGQPIVAATLDTNMYTLTATDEGGSEFSLEFSVGIKNLEIAQQPVGGELPHDGSGVQVSIEMAEGTEPFTYTLCKAYGAGEVKTQDSPVFTITDTRTYWIYVEDATGRWASSDYFYCTPYDSDFVCDPPETVYMTHPDEEVPLLLNPVGSQFPYSATWYYRPEGSDADYKPLYKTGLEVWVNKLGEYKYVVSDKNGEEHEGMIRVAYEGEEPWIIGNPKSVTLNNRVEEDYSTSLSVEVLCADNSSLLYSWEYSTDRGENWISIATYSTFSTGGHSPTLNLYGPDCINRWYRCRVTNVNGIKKEAVSKIAVVDTVIELVSVKQVKSTIEVRVKGGKTPYGIRINRHRDGYWSPKDKKEDRNRYVEERYSSDHVISRGIIGDEESFVIEVDRWASDWYKSSGIFNAKKHYHRFAWTYEFTIWDATGQSEILVTYTCTVDKNLEWAKY